MHFDRKGKTHAKISDSVCNGLKSLNLRAFDRYFILKGHKDCYCLYDAEPATKTLMSFPVERKATDTQSKDIP